MVMCGAVLVTGSCDGASRDGSTDDLGQVQVALTQVPTDARCLRLTANAPARQITRQVPLTVGAAAFTTTFGGLPVGALTVSGDVFGVACSNVGSSTVATWVSDPVSVTTTLGGMPSVSLLMHRPGSVGVSVDFCATPPCTPTTVTCAAGQQLCISTNMCVSTSWGFEPGEPFAWGNNAETNSSLSTAQHHSGNTSLQATPSSDPTLPAGVLSLPCTTDSTQVVMDLRGKSFSAWIFVPAAAGSSFANTSCRISGLDPSFVRSTLGATATKAPVVPGAWFQLTGTFPSTTLESRIYELSIECLLPPDWGFADPSKVWFVDDVRVQ